MFENAQENKYLDPYVSDERLHIDKCTDFAMPMICTDTALAKPHYGGDLSKVYEDYQKEVTPLLHTAQKGLRKQNVSHCIKGLALPYNDSTAWYKTKEFKIEGGVAPYYVV